MSTTRIHHHRRPPRGASNSAAAAAAAAATRPKNILEQTAMQQLQFRQKVQQANAISICNSTSAQVGRMPLRKILAMDLFCVPVFQRRYCWDETQWQTLLTDAAKAGSTNRQPHSMGRLTCTGTENNNNDNSSLLVGVQGRSCILDGQQRLTTTTILLAAIRDQLERFLQQQESTTTDLPIDIDNYIQTIQKLLFVDLKQLHEWTVQEESSGSHQCYKMKEGVELSFARLIPTFCDRLAYYTAILPSTRGTNSNTPEVILTNKFPRPLQAKHFFLRALQQEYDSLPKLTMLLQGVLDGLTMLYFPVDVNSTRNSKDGTEDLMVIYERLALRDATFCKPTRSSEYRSMDGSDMIRNLLLGSFANEKDALAFYQQYWLPLEQIVEDQESNKYDNGNYSSMAQVLESFLTEQRGVQEDDNDEIASGIIGGKLYFVFQSWFAKRLVLEDGDAVDHASSLEDKVRDVGKDLLNFGRRICRE